MTASIWRHFNNTVITFFASSACCNENTCAHYLLHKYVCSTGRTWLLIKPSRFTNLYCKTLHFIIDHQPTFIVTVNKWPEEHLSPGFSRSVQSDAPVLVSSFSLAPNKLGGQFHCCHFTEEKWFLVCVLSEKEKMELSTNTGVDVRHHTLSSSYIYIRMLYMIHILYDIYICVMLSPPFSLCSLLPSPS